MAARESTGTTTTGATTATGAGGFGRLAKYQPTAHAILRIGAGLLFMQHGAQKLFGWFGGMDGAGATVELVSQMGLAGVLEFFGGLLIVIGLFTQPLAIILMIEMVWAVFQAHLPQGLVPIQNGAELPLLYALIWLYLAASGAGPASVDERMGGRGG